MAQFGIIMMAELAERSPIVIQNSSNPSSRENLDVRPYDRATDRTRCYLQHARLTVPRALSYNQSLNGHGEVANESPLILPRTLSIVGALVLLKRRAGKKNGSSAFRLA